MKTILYTFAIAWLMSSCVEVINLKHDNTDPILIVDAQITDQPGPYDVKLSTTISFNSNDRSLLVNDALVTISDNAGNEEDLTFTENGIYQTNSFQGVVGRTYSLTIQYNGQTYTAQSTMLPVSEIDTLFSSFQQATNFLDAGYYVSLAAAVSVPNNINYYRWKLYENDSLYNGREDIFVADDEYAEGEFEFRFDYPFEINDQVRIEMYSLNKDALDYYNGFVEVLQSDGGFFSPPPVNAPSNISNGALGLFQANAVSIREITIAD